MTDHKRPMDDPAWREAQYNARAAVPEHPEIFARWAEDGADYRAKVAGNARLDIAYGPEEGETLDLFQADAGGDALSPLMIFIHGGYWQALDKSDFSWVAAPLVAAGVSVAVVNYDLCPTVRVGDIVGQMRDACAWAWRHGAHYGIDRHRIHVSGHSAGGHLTAVMLATDWPDIHPDLPRGLIKSGLSISGVFDPEPLIGTSINDKLGLDAAEARGLNAIAMAPHGAAPLIAAVGGLEPGEFHRQSDEIKRVWGDFGTPVKRITLEGCNHMTAVDQLGKPDGSLVPEALALIEGRFKP